jgi:hypothetical protein
MRSFTFPIRTVFVAIPVLALSACATPDYTSQLAMARQARCPEQTVLVCHEQTSLHKNCACVARHEYQSMLQATRF